MQEPSCKSFQMTHKISSYTVCFSFTLDQKFVNKWALIVSRISLLQLLPEHKIVRTSHRTVNFKFKRNKKI